MGVIKGKTRDQGLHGEQRKPEQERKKMPNKRFGSKWGGQRDKVGPLGENIREAMLKSQARKT